MKNAMKRIMSFLLIAVLLVSAVPFQAMAATVYKYTIAGTEWEIEDEDGIWTREECIEFFSEGDNDPDLLAEIDEMIKDITFPVNLKGDEDEDDGGADAVLPDNKDEEDEDEEKDSDDYVEFLRPGDDYTPVFTLRCVVNGTQTWKTTERANGVTYGDIMDKHFTEDEGYTYKLTSKIYDKVLTSVAVPDGDVVTIHITTDYKDNELNSGSSSSSGSSHDGDAKVYLGIYINHDTDDMARCIDVTKYVEDEEDPYLDRYEAQRAIKKYYTAKDGYSMKMYGLFTHSTWKEFRKDRDVEGAESIAIDRRGDDVYIYVLVNNVKTGGTYVADSSNPKTGDEIFVTVTALGLSASALVCLYFLNKKRMAR